MNPRVLLPIRRNGRENEEEFVTEAKAGIAKIMAAHPGYDTYEIEPDDNYDKLWLHLKPKEDYIMDEGL